MSDIKNNCPTVEERYENLYELNGAVMDAASYAKHMTEIPELADQAAAEYQEHERASVDELFSAPQDFRQIAAKQIEADRQREFRPDCASYAIPRFIGETGIETETHFVIGQPCVVRTGSGSYLSSGSFSSYVTSGSYRTSGSYVSSGSYHRSSSGSFRMSSEQPYMGSFDWDFENGGYGLNLI